MKLKIEVKKLDDGRYMAFVDCTNGDAKQTETPGGIVYADSGGEAYEILSGRLKAKGYSVIQ